jgi:hypothetical protein
MKKGKNEISQAVQQVTVKKGEINFRMVYSSVKRK